MTYLSRIWLNPLRSGTQPLLRNAQATHAAVLGGLARQPVTERVLWRLETTQAHRAELLVLTESTPSWEHLVEHYGWPHADDPQALVRDYQPLLDHVHAGREFRLRMRANPVTALRKPASPSPQQAERLTAERPRGARIPQRTAGQQTTWFTERLLRWGFEPLIDTNGYPAVALIARDRVSFRKKAGAGGAPVTLSTATFDAAVRVTDPEVARHSLVHGVGHARAYGCGLITLAPRGPAGTGG
jgi:CRISPR system Cascade subunit CasE